MVMLNIDAIKQAHRSGGLVAADLEEMRQSYPEGSEWYLPGDSVGKVIGYRSNGIEYHGDSRTVVAPPNALDYGVLVECDQGGGTCLFPPMLRGRILL